MRYLKITSATNPDSDYVLLNGGYFNPDGQQNIFFSDFEGFLCTQFQTLGISRELEFLTIENRNINVKNKPDFKKYSLTVEILTKYAEYEAKYQELITFLDRNKYNGFRLYYRPYNGMETRYCLCDIETSSKLEKLQPVTLTLTQNSLWLGDYRNARSSQTQDASGNVFAFKKNGDYYSAAFALDSDVNGYYCIRFYSGIETVARIVNNCYNEIPLTIRIYGACKNPVVSFFRKNEDIPFKQIQVFADISEDYYIEINSNILENGVWCVNSKTGHKLDYTDLLNYSYGSPYVYIDNGEYTARVTDAANNKCVIDIFWQEEYS